MFLRKIAQFIAPAFIAASLVGLTAAPAHAVVYNANGAAVNFSNNAVNKVGDGTAVGDKVLFTNAITIGGQAIDVLVTTVSKTSTTINDFDGGSAIGGSVNAPAGSASPDQMLQTNITTSAAGSVKFKFDFLLGGSYQSNGTFTAVTLSNVTINSYDLDSSGNSASERQYTEFTGFQSYTLASNTTLAITSAGGLTRFQSTVAANYSSSDGSYTKGRVKVTYDFLSSIEIAHGTAVSGGTAYFALDFSLGLGWTEGSNTVLTSTVTNSYNTPPTSTNTTPSATAGTTYAVTRADFGTYADVDNNPFVQVKITSLPNGILERDTGSGWVAVLTNDIITIADIDAGKLRYNGSASTDVIGFKVYDGLVYSTAAYTMTISNTGGVTLTPQVITFTQPADTTTATTTVTLAPTADSNLTVALTSSTPSVCTVSGFVVTILSAGTCTLAANQPGNSTYAAATQVTRSFQVTAPALTPQVITFTQPADTTTATTTVTLAPTADSNLTVVLTSSTPSVCTVSGFVVTILSAGTCTLAANQPGNSTYAAATQVTRSFQVTAPQSNSNNNSTPTPVVTPTPTPSPTTSATPVAQSTNNKKPVELKLPEVPQGGTACLLETNDTDCSTGKVVVPGQGTWTVGANNQVKFTPEPGFVGTARATFKIASLGSITLFPLSVKVTKRPPVTTTIGNFIDGSPVITAEIGKRIAAFIKKYSDYRTIECIGYTEGPTVLKTDKALSLARATNACGYVKKTLKKSFVQVPLKAKQDTVENNQRRRITITLRD